MLFQDLGDEDNFESLNLFKKIGILKLQEIVDKRNVLKLSLPDVHLIDDQGIIQYDDYIAQWQEWRCIYETIINTLTDDIKSMI